MKKEKRIKAEIDFCGREDSDTSGPYNTYKILVGGEFTGYLYMIKDLDLDPCELTFTENNTIKFSCF